MESKPILRFELTRTEFLKHYDEVSGPQKDSKTWEEPMPEKVDMGYDYVEFELIDENTIRCAQYPGGGVPFWWKPDYVMLERGHSVLVVEHNTDVIKAADWVIDLGPDAGERGGEVVFAGTPEDLAKKDTFTAQYIR